MPMNLSRSLLTIILPGTVALGPWLLLLLVVNSTFQHWYENFRAPFHFASFALAVVVGGAFETAGNYIEKRWDERKSRESPEVPEDWVSKDWFKYLTKENTVGGPIVFRYLSRKVTALYFEIGMMFATPIAVVGFALLGVQLSSQDLWIGIIAGVLVVAAPLVIWISARGTHALLCEVRHAVFGEG